MKEPTTDPETSLDPDAARSAPVSTGRPPSRAELQRLAEHRAPPCVSIYRTLAADGDPDLTNPVRLKNALQEAETQLAQQGLGKPELDKLLAPLHELVPERALGWQGARSLALLHSPQHTRLTLLPQPLPDETRVGDRFYLKPLMRLLGGSRSFSLLALSQQQVRLFDGDEAGLLERPLGEIPARLQDVVGHDYEERSVQFHTRSPAHGTPGAPDGRDGVFHGQGRATDAREAERTQFLKAVARGVEATLAESEQPLVVAAVKELQAAFRKECTLPTLLPDGVEGSPDGRSAVALHGDAWPLVEQHLSRQRQEATRRYQETADEQRKSARAEEVIRAAIHGRVDTLFTTAERPLWGRYLPDRDEVILGPKEPRASEPGADTADALKGHGDAEDLEDREDLEDLADRAAVETLRQGGQVLVWPEAEIPEGAPLAALFRYPQPEA